MESTATPLHNPAYPPSQTNWPSTLLHWTSLVLVGTVWVSAGLFGLYIIAFYAAALFGGDLEQWNGLLPDIYTPGETVATSGIGLHFAAGGLILILGSIQLVDVVRVKYPSIHHWIGRFYIAACLLAGLGGLTFILVKGTIGGAVMNAGFALYGLLMLLAGVQTFRFARKREVDKHRAWALRLYALAIGSWLYRMDYGFWLMLADGAGHADNFTGPFDYFMDFFFYIPNLIVAEVFIRARNVQSSAPFKVIASLVLVGTTAFLGIGTYYFTKLYWGPAIIDWIF